MEYKNIDPLECAELNFTNEADDELAQDIFETAEEYKQRIYNRPLQQIGTATLNKYCCDNHTGLAFPKFSIECDDKIICSDVKAFVANVQGREVEIVGGKIVAGLKVVSGKVYCDYDRVYLQSQNGDKIQLTAICWTKHAYEDEYTFSQRLKYLPMLPLGIARPIRKEYNLNTQCLPFKVSLYKYVQPALNFDKVFATIEKHIAKEFCTLEENFTLYGKVAEMLNADDWTATLRHTRHKSDIKCRNQTKNSIDVIIDTANSSNSSYNSMRQQDFDAMLKRIFGH